MKLSFKLLLGSLLMLILSCNKDEPVKACIELDKSTISVGESINFTSCSENEWSYIWRITGPDSAVENNLQWNDRIFERQFDTPGSYSIKLTAFSDFSFLGDASSDSTSFTVNE